MAAATYHYDCLLGKTNLIYQSMNTIENISMMIPVTARLILPKKSPDGFYSVNHDHMHNLYIIAGTLAGALLIALCVLLGCYCKIHETYRVITSRIRGYHRQRK